MSFRHPFPATRPAIAITESDNKITQLDLPELQWWPIIPSPGNRSMQATYEADTLEMSAVTEMVVTGPARVHDLDCVEIAVQERAIREDWDVPGRPHLFYARPRRGGDEMALRGATVRRQESAADVSGRVVRGRLGPGRESARSCDNGRYQRQPDGAYRTTDGQGIGAGTYDVTIGEKTFHCLRVWDTAGSPPSEHAELSEAYIEPGGRVVLFREYWGRHMGKGDTDWAVKYPNNVKIAIDGCVYVHCDCTGRAHDIITNTALGVDLP